MTTTVLIVDDEPGILTTLSGVLSDEGYGTLTTGSGRDAVELYRAHHPDVVFLDIWLPDRDGLETLQTLRELDPAVAVVMMSGHGTASTAVKAIKMGAFDYIEKPLSYNEAVDAVEGALKYRESVSNDSVLLQSLRLAATKAEAVPELAPPPPLAILQTVDKPQRTLAGGRVLYGLGLHSGNRTGMTLQPLPIDTGLHFMSLPTNTYLPAHVDCVAETDYATTLSRDGQNIKTVEHLLSALRARGVTNLLIKVHGEIPVLDGSALEFCEALDAVGVVDQDAPRKELVIDRVYEVAGEGGKSLRIEPAEVFSARYELSYPPPIGKQVCDFTLSSYEAYRREIAPARTFGFMRDLRMMAELGLGGGGRLDNCILVGEDNVINTQLRFDDEFARHKVLDIIGDLYLLGYPIRGRVTARVTGHKMNIALLREIAAAG
jgi:UDP-3-O-[3-hydroxymyristoyl] N-acetylglucosamine deacetylase